MPVKILADEDVDSRIIKHLRDQGYQVISVREDFKGTKDKEVLELARANFALLLTEDSDFGEWIFAYKEENVGVVFLRYRPPELPAILAMLPKVLERHADSLHEKFVVITPRKIRIRVP